MVYYESKKDVKRQAYVDPLNTSDAILLQEEVPLKFHTGKRKRKSAISLFLPFHLNV